ncbi:MAG: DUF1800 domain-containing protein [Tepidisphaeraceae bacterium]|jgi:hypothetical protein
MSSHPLLQPYTPTSSDPFDAVKAAHLLNRAGFGGTAAEIEHARSLGPQAALDELLDFPDAPAEEQSETDVPDLSAIDGVPKTLRALALQIATASEADKKTLRQKFNQANQAVMLAMGGWWMKHMAYGPHPLQEKLTLFWHGHFTTSSKDERMAELMWQQNELLRQNAAGNFAAMVHGISRDPAMLDYLNNTQNKKAHPNENYARELMELFTLGIGNYTENDVKQGARAFTGWSHDGEKFIFMPNQHDYGVKSYLDYVGDFNGDDVVDIILRHPACAPFIAGEMYRYFVSEDLDPKLQAALGAELRGADYELRPFLRTLFTSKAFYNSQVIGAQIKSPVQLLAGTIRLLAIDMPDERVIQQQLTQMGQVPFQPPNVRGWIGGRNWINTGTIFIRYNAGVTLTSGPTPNLRNEPLGDSSEELVDRWVARLIQRPIDPDQRQILVDAAGDAPPRFPTLKKIVQLIVSMPEYQLC